MTTPPPGTMDSWVGGWAVDGEGRTFLGHLAPSEVGSCGWWTARSGMGGWFVKLEDLGMRWFRLGELEVWNVCAGTGWGRRVLWFDGG